MRFLAALLILGAFPASRLVAQSFDLVILNGRIIDGTGSPWYAGDVGIRDGRIAAIGRLEGAKAKRTVDAAGKVVAPGFIDMLGQSEMGSWWSRACRRRSFRGSRPRSPARAAPRRRSTTPSSPPIARVRPARHQARLADAGPVLREAGAAGDRAEHGDLRRCHPGAADGPGRRRQGSRRRPSSTGCGSWCGRRCGRARSGCPPRSSTRRRRMRRPRS